MKKDRLEILFDKILEILHIHLKVKTKKLLLQLFKFALVGGLAFIIDYGILVFCKEILHFGVLLSAAIGFSISVIVNYILSVKWIFEVDKNKSKKKNFIIFIIFSVIGLGLTELIMWFGVDILSISYLIIKIIATIIVMVFNFVTRKMFLEKRK